MLTRKGICFHSFKMDVLSSFITTGMIIGLFHLKLVSCKSRQMLFHKHSSTPQLFPRSVFLYAAQASSPQYAGLRCGTDDSCDVLDVSNYAVIEENFVYAFKEEDIYIFDDGVRDLMKGVSGRVTVGSYFEFKVRLVGAKELKSVNDQIFILHAYGTYTVLNSLINGQHGAEEDSATHVFTQERSYNVRCTITSDNIQVDVDGSSYHTYAHRTSFTPITQITFFAHDQTSKVEMLKIYLPEPQ